MANLRHKLRSQLPQDERYAIYWGSPSDSPRHDSPARSAPRLAVAWFESPPRRHSSPTRSASSLAVAPNPPNTRPSRKTPSATLSALPALDQLASLVSVHAKVGSLCVRPLCGLDASPATGRRLALPPASVARRSYGSLPTPDTLLALRSSLRSLCRSRVALAALRCRSAQLQLPPAELFFAFVTPATRHFLTLRRDPTTTPPPAGSPQSFLPFLLLSLRGSRLALSVTRTRTPPPEASASPAARNNPPPATRLRPAQKKNQEVEPPDTPPTTRRRKTSTTDELRRTEP